MTVDGTGVVPHAGWVAVRLLADRVCLTQGLSTALARRSFRPVHDRSRVLVDLTALLADGGEAIADIDVLRHQRQVLGPVASAPTVCRTLDALTLAAMKRVEKARARVRHHVWAQLASRGGRPASRVAGADLGETDVLDVDPTLVGVWCDNSQEMSAAMLRPGNAGSDTTS